MNYRSLEGPQANTLKVFWLHFDQQRWQLPHRSSQMDVDCVSRLGLGR